MKTQNSKNLYKAMQRFADITIGFMVQGKFNRASKCLLTADRLFHSGNNLIKNAVSNVFVYSLSRVLDKHDELSTKILEMMPFSLKNEYDLQVNTTGC